MLIHLYLQTIPNDSLVEEVREKDEDTRAIFLIVEYEALIEDGFNLPAITNTTTLGDLKDNLTKFSMYHPREMQEILYDFADKFLPNETTLREDYVTKGPKEPRSLKQIIIIWVVALFSAIVLIVLLAGILSGNISFTSIFNSILNIFGLAINHAQ